MARFYPTEQQWSDALHACGVDDYHLDYSTRLTHIDIGGEGTILASPHDGVPPNHPSQVQYYPDGDNPLLLEVIGRAYYLASRHFWEGHRANATAP